MQTIIIPTKPDIQKAHHLIEPFVHCTPVLTSQTFDTLYNSRLYFKAENFRKAGSFKSRGAVNAVFSLTKEAAKKGVATHSSVPPVYCINSTLIIMIYTLSLLFFPVLYFAAPLTLLFLCYILLTETIQFPY